MARGSPPGRQWDAGPWGHPAGAAGPVERGLLWVLAAGDCLSQVGFTGLSCRPNVLRSYWIDPVADNHQPLLPYIPHEIAGQTVSQRQRDGYINATTMCKAAGKNFSDYTRIGPTKAFLTELSSVTGIPITELIQSLSGGVPHLQGSWVHPQVAINLAQWLSARFAVMVSQWVHDWMGARPNGGRLPFHLRRYVANQRNVPVGHFSVLTEMTLALIAPMESVGYQLPERLWPDISQGKMFARFLREEHGVDTDKMPTYQHDFEDGRHPVQPKAYPNAYLSIFREHFVEVWMPERMIAYFTEKDPKALPYLEKALPLPAPNTKLLKSK